MTFFCKRTPTADGRTRWSICVPTFMGVTTVAWFYSEALAHMFLCHLASDPEVRSQAEDDAWREFQFRLDFLWSEKLQEERSILETHWKDVRLCLNDYNEKIELLLKSCADEKGLQQGFKELWETSHEELAQKTPLHRLAVLLQQQQRVFHSLQTELIAQSALRATMQQPLQ